MTNRRPEGVAARSTGDLTGSIVAKVVDARLCWVQERARSFQHCAFGNGPLMHSYGALHVDILGRQP